MSSPASLLLPIGGETFTELVLAEIGRRTKRGRPRHWADLKFDFGRFSPETHEKQFEPAGGEFAKETQGFLAREVARGVKEQVLRRQSAPREGEAEPAAVELPDGERLQFDEPLGFNRFFFDFKAGNEKSVELHSAIMQAFYACDVDARKQITTNIAVCGGNSLLPGFPEALEESVNALANNSFKSKVFASPRSHERKMASWIGASIMGSTGAFQNMWISRHEYAELGNSAIRRKCVN